MTNTKCLTTLVLGTALTLGSCGSMVYDEITNVDGDGWRPANGLVSRAIGVRRGYVCEYKGEWLQTTILPTVRENKGYYHKEVGGIRRAVSVLDSPWLGVLGGVTLFGIAAYRLENKD